MFASLCVLFKSVSLDWRKASGESQVYPLRIPHEPVGCVLLLNLPCVLRGAVWVQRSIFISLFSALSCIQLLQVAGSCHFIFDEKKNWDDTEICFQIHCMWQKSSFHGSNLVFPSSGAITKTLFVVPPGRLSLSSSAETHWKKKGCVVLTGWCICAAAAACSRAEE